VEFDEEETENTMGTKKSGEREKETEYESKETGDAGPPP
jgi:hypothetical protein